MTLIGIEAPTVRNRGYRVSSRHAFEREHSLLGWWVSDRHAISHRVPPLRHRHMGRHHERAKVRGIVGESVGSFEIEIRRAWFLRGSCSRNERH